MPFAVARADASAAMSEAHHLARAPISEALIHFQANASNEWTPELMKEKLQRAWTEHTIVQVTRPVEFIIAQETGKQPAEQISFPTVEAVIFRSPKVPTVYQVRRSGLLVSWLPPYQNWERFRDEALLAWETFRLVVPVGQPSHLTLRFINRLEFPLEGFQLSRFFTAPPPRPPGLSTWGFKSFTGQSFLAVPDSPFLVNLIFARTEGTLEKIGFILDIEVSLSRSLLELAQEPPSVLEEMREIKNTAFFSSLTEEAIAYYS